MSLVCRRVDILSVPTAREIDLSAYPVRAGLGGELVEAGRYAIEVQAKECHGLLCKAGWVILAKSRVTTDHAEIVRECSCRARGVEMTAPPVREVKLPFCH